jgi:PAS domain S-box-containing protein
MARRIVESGAEMVLRTPHEPYSEDCWLMGDTTRPSLSLLFVPIRNRTKVIGILSIQSYTPNAYDRQDLETLQTLADHCGGALERISAEQALHESEQCFRDLFEGSPDAIFVEDVHGRVIDANPAACDLHAYGHNELIGKHVSELVPRDAVDAVEKAFPDLLSGRLRHLEGCSLRSDGVAVPVEIRANPIHYGGNSALLLHVRDITSRRSAEEALRSSEMLFHSVWNNSVDGMRLTDEDGNVVAVNEAYCQLVGKTRDELEGRPFSQVYAPSDSSPEMLAEYRERFRARVVKQQSERRMTLHNGSVLDLEFTSSFVELPGRGSLLFTLFRDITAQKRLEDQLRQSQKMEAIGQLAGGVAHDFNNILTVIHGHASLLLANDPAGGHTSRSAQQIAQAAERAAGLTRQLLAFGRRQVLQPRRLDVNEVVGNMTKMLVRLLGEDVTLQVDYSETPAFIHADVGMIEQVLLNLAVNSRDAMAKGGLLSLQIQNVEISTASVAYHAEARDGSFVCISAADTGCGIPPENLSRIFEPFFTTKEIGKGTGLGLATVYGIVKQHFGWIEVDSELGRGATFRIYLPACDQTADPGEDRADRGQVRGGTETILVVEDESLVRELVCTLLVAQGYRVLQAESGVKALQVWENAKSQIDLVLTDLVMPDQVNGRELAERLWSEKPDLKVIFTSGYSADVVGKDFVLGHGLQYLQKPYHPQKLAYAVRQCLDAVN